MEEPLRLMLQASKTVGGHRREKTPQAKTEKKHHKEEASQRKNKLQHTLGIEIQDSQPIANFTVSITYSTILIENQIQHQLLSIQQFIIKL